MYCVITNDLIFNCNSIYEIIIFLYDKKNFLNINNVEELKNNYTIYEYDEFNKVSKKYNGLELIQFINKGIKELINIVINNYEKLINSLNNIMCVNSVEQIKFIKTINQLNIELNKYINIINQFKYDISKTENISKNGVFITNNEVMQIPENIQNSLNNKNSYENKLINKENNINDINFNNLNEFNNNSSFTIDILKPNNNLKINNSTVKQNISSNEINTNINNKINKLNKFFEPLINDNVSSVAPSNFDNDDLKNCAIIDDSVKILKTNDININKFDTSLKELNNTDNTNNFDGRNITNYANNFDNIINTYIQSFKDKNSEIDIRNIKIFLLNDKIPLEINKNKMSNYYTTNYNQVLQGIMDLYKENKISKHKSIELINKLDERFKNAVSTGINIVNV